MTPSGGAKGGSSGDQKLNRAPKGKYLGSMNRPSGATLTDIHVKWNPEIQPATAVVISKEMGFKSKHSIERDGGVKLMLWYKRIWTAFWSISNECNL
jgi:hypothetical protein